jgi:hypothetical protein
LPIGDRIGALIHGHGQLVSHELSAVLKILTEKDGNSWQKSIQSMDWFKGKFYPETMVFTIKYRGVLYFEMGISGTKISIPGGKPKPQQAWGKIWEKTVEKSGKIWKNLGKTVEKSGKNGKEEILVGGSALPL